MPYLLQLDANGAAVKQWPLQERPLLVGRAVQGDAQILDPRMSRRHFIITPVNEKYFIRDLASTNGTFVNGRQIAKHELQPDDRIQAGETTFRFVRELPARV
jgi:pSer/pThr/pTyr-binding forkhead associated (FHA) protein